LEIRVCFTALCEKLTGVRSSIIKQQKLTFRSAFV